MKFSSVSLFLFLISFAFLNAPKLAYSAEQVYGWQLMSVKEKNQYYQDLKNLETDWERKLYLKKLNKKMKFRARKYGLALDKPYTNTAK